MSFFVIDLPSEKRLLNIKAKKLPGHRQDIAAEQWH